MLELAIFLSLVSLLTIALLAICNSYCEEEMTIKIELDLNDGGKNF